MRTGIHIHSKTPLEQLHLETATLSIPQIIATRRLIYLQTILKRPKGELIRNIYEAMKEDPLPGDWCQQIQNDFEKINLHMNENLIELMNAEEYKVLIKSKVKEEAFKEFKNMQAGHQKGNTLFHDDLKQPQSYLMTKPYPRMSCVKTAY